MSHQEIATTFVLAWLGLPFAVLLRRNGPAMLREFLRNRRDREV